MANTVNAPAAAQYLNTTTVAKQYDVNCTSGSTLVGIFTSDPSFVATLSVADDVNGSWTSVVSTSDLSGKIQIFYFQNNAATGKPTVTGTLSLASYGYLQIYEVVGAPASSLDVSGSQNDTNDSSIALAVAANATIVAGIATYPSPTTADGGYTVDLTQTQLYNSYHKTEHIADAGASGTKTLTFGGLTGIQHQTFAAASFKSSGGVSFIAKPNNIKGQAVKRAGTF